MKNWKKNIILFLISQAVTLFGSTVVQMAIIWFVTKQTSSGIWVAVFTICSYLPQFIISFAGGIWADRYDRKRIIIFADAVIAFVTFIMFILMTCIDYSEHLNILLYALLIMSVVRSFGAGIQTPAVNAVLPSIVQETELMRFNGINITFQSVMQFAAPAVAGVLLSYSTISYTLLVDVFTAAVGISICLFVFIPRIPAGCKQTAVSDTDLNDKKPAFFADMRYGFCYAASSRLIKRVLIVYGLFVFLSVPAGFLAQLYVNRTYGTTYWYMTAVELVGFLGMTGGGILMSTWGGFKNRQKTLAAGLALFGILAAGMGLSTNFILYLGCMLIYGISLTVTQTATTTLIQENTEAAAQGRVFGLLSSAYAFSLPIGMTVFGPLSDIISMKIIMIASGTVLALIGGIVHLYNNER